MSNDSAADSGEGGSSFGSCCDPVVDSTQLSDYDWHLINAHGVIHIIFWIGFMSFHFAFILYKRLSNHPFDPPHDRSYRWYMLVHHIVGGVDIGAIIMALVFGGRQGDNAAALLNDSTYAAGHRVAGILILAFACFMETIPVLFGRFKNEHVNLMLRVVHKLVGKLLLGWVVCFQVWSGIRMIGWDMQAMAAVYTYVACAFVVIISLAIAVQLKLRKSLTDLTNKYATGTVNVVNRDKVYTLDDLKMHTKEDDVWIAINGYVINATSFLVDHPGGAAAIMKFAGEDASKAWNLNHERSFIQKYARGLVIGRLEGTDTAIMNELNEGVAIQEVTSEWSSNTQEKVGGPKFGGPRVIIIGGGLAGLSAAHMANRSGVRVLLLDKMAFCGGNSVKATSGINGAGTRIQAALGIQDDWNWFNDDMYKSAAKGATDAENYELAQVMTRESARCIHWLLDEFSLNLCEVGRLAAQSAPRTHRGATKFPGMMITSKLLDDLKFIESDGSGSVEIINKARAIRLLTKQDDEGGEGKCVDGVEFSTPNGTFQEKGDVVIIATGGWAADFSDDGILGNYRPDLLSFPTTNGIHCTGDGIKLAQQIGACMIGLDWVQVHPTGIVDPKDPSAKVKTLAAEALRGADGLLLNRFGKRFCNELGRRDYISDCMNQSENAPPYRLVLNSCGIHEMNWHVRHYESMGIMQHIKNGAELAALIGCSPDSLETTFRLYQQHAAYQQRDKPNKNKAYENVQSIQDPYGKKLFKYASEWTMSSDFYVAWVTPVVHYCMGGIKINARAQVLRCDDGNVNLHDHDYLHIDPAHGYVAIEGVYACGECTGGVHGKNRLGGSSLLDCVCYGRIAGREAATSLLQKHGRRAMIGVETVDQSDPDIIIENTNSTAATSAASSSSTLHDERFNSTISRTQSNNN